MKQILWSVGALICTLDWTPFASSKADLDPRNSAPQWVCLSSKDIDVACLAYGDDGDRPLWSPTVSILDKRHLHEFAGETLSLRDCNDTKARIQLVTEGQDNLCFYASYLQRMQGARDSDWDRHTYWVLERVRSETRSFGFADPVTVTSTQVSP